MGLPPSAGAVRMTRKEEEVVRGVSSMARAGWEGVLARTAVITSEVREREAVLITFIWNRTFRTTFAIKAGRSVTVKMFISGLSKRSAL